MAKNDYTQPDFYSLKAKDEGYLARSIYKLQEIDQKYQLFKKKMTILDIGAFPGSWSQYALKKVGKKGQVVGIDIKKIEKVNAPNFFAFHQSITDENLNFDEFLPFDMVISDMAPNTSGVKITDVLGSQELTLLAAQKAKVWMKRAGTFIGKVFQGEGFDEFYKEIRLIFKKVKSIKPKAVRKSSKEIYVIGWELKE